MSLIAEQFEHLRGEQDDGVHVEHPGEVQNGETQEATSRTDGIAETLGENPGRDGEDCADDGCGDRAEGIVDSPADGERDDVGDDQAEELVERACGPDENLV